MGRQGRERNPIHSVSMSKFLCKTVGTAQMGLPREACMEHTSELYTGMQETESWFTKTYPGDISLQVSQHALQTGQAHPCGHRTPLDRDTRISQCLVKLPGRDFWESNSIYQTLLAGFLLHQNALLPSKWSSWYPQRLLWVLSSQLALFWLPWKASLHVIRPKAKLLDKVKSR